jgi:uncharacterized membrane protein SpoIIM required for sporulation
MPAPPAKGVKPAGLRRYLLARRPDWEQLGKLESEARPRGLSLEQGEQLVTGYRQLSRDVASVRRDQPGTKLALQLEALYRRLHRRLYAPFEPVRARAAALFRVEVPASARRLVPALRVVGAIFFGAAGIGALLTWAFPELITLFANEDMVRGVQEGKLWTEKVFSIAPGSVLAVGIATNNIVVTLTAWVLGVFYGIGTLYIIGLNGLLLGALFAYTAQFGMADELAFFVLAHGPAELSIIAIGGAAGLRLGEALARPGQRTHTEAFREAVHDTSRVFLVCVPFLVVCGVVEGLMSPDPQFGWLSRGLMGASLALLLWRTLFGLYPAPRAQPAVLVE